jgi:hypothetical protein
LVINLKVNSHLWTPDVLSCPPVEKKNNNHYQIPDVNEISENVGITTSQKKKLVGLTNTMKKTQKQKKSSSKLLLFFSFFAWFLVLLMLFGKYCHKSIITIEIIVT